ncbi:hypothetical protein ACFLQU_04555 [Verrucomicrobiota bacterium]
MDSDEQDLEVLRQAMAEEESLDLEPGTGTAGRTPHPPDALPLDETADEQIDLEESTDALREALLQEKSRTDAG